MLRDGFLIAPNTSFFCWTNAWYHFPALQFIVACRGQEGVCVVTKAEDWGKATGFLGHTPKSPDDSQIGQVISFS